MHPTIALTEYFPYRIVAPDGSKIKNPKANKNTGLILDIKSHGENPEKANRALMQYSAAALEAAKRINQTCNIDVIALVPSHRAGAHSKPLEILINFLGARLKLETSPTLLVRKTEIAKLATGGDRSFMTHFKSISVTSLDLQQKSVLLIDDVVTTGNSLQACDAVLRLHGAANIYSIALGKTTY